MNAKDLADMYPMISHEENGRFLEWQYADEGPGRPASGSIYYYLGPKETAKFHVIDCDEYWAWHAGTPLELWSIRPDGTLTKHMLGTGQGMQPLVWFRAGEVFGARHLAGAQDGTFLSCITVPRFDYRGWRLVERDEAVRLCPAAAEFYA